MTDLASAVAQMRAMGMPDFPPGHPKVGVGKFTRYGPGKKAWYKLNELRTRSGKYVIVGAYGMWGGVESSKIEVDWKDIGAEERQELLARQRAAEEAEREKRAERAAYAANRARGQWRSAYTVDQAREKGITSAYLERKGVLAENCHLAEDGTLLIPMMAYDDGNAGRLVGLQKIAPDGTKRFNKNMAKEGAACRLGKPPEPGQPILLAEGYATGGSIRIATDRLYPVYLAFDAGNLLPVANILRARYPDSPILICADDDWKTEINGTPVNVGKNKAMAVLSVVPKSFMVVPLFPVAADRQDKWTDFNDLHLAYGIETVRPQIAEALATLVAGCEAALASESNSTPEQPDGDGGPPADQFVGPDNMVGSGSSGEPPNTGAPPEPPPVEMWRMRLQRSPTTGNVKPTMHNAFLYLTNDPAWEGVLGYDLFAETVVKLKPPPYEGGTLGEWNDLDDHRTMLWMSSRIGEPGGDTLIRAVLLAAHGFEFNPLRDKFESIKWDGVPRVETWLIDWCHALKSRKARRKRGEELGRLEQYLKWVGQRWLIGAVARVYEPGCQMDNMLILESEGGFRKSTLFRTLGGEFFTDARLNFQDKDSLLILQGRHIIEMAELEGMNKADSSETKRFITHREDLFRPPYGRRLVKFPRRCVFGGTVNLGVYLKDETGNRRFWPVQTGGVVDIAAFSEIVDQLWAEAVQLYKEGERWWVEPHEKPIFEEQQDDRFVQDLWEADIVDFLDAVGNHVGGQRYETVTASEIMANCLKLDMARRDQQAARRVGSIMARIGWHRERSSTGSRHWFYERPQPLAEDGAPRESGDGTNAGQPVTLDETPGGDDVPF